MAALPPDQRARILEIARISGLQGVDLANLIRANMASFDISWPRQAALLIPGNPVKSSQAFLDSLRGAWSQQFADDIDRAIHNSPLFADYERLVAEGGADFIRPLDGVVAHKSEAAEDFMALARIKGDTMPRPFVWVAEHTPWIRISARAHVTGLNSLTWRLFTSYRNQLLDINEQIASGAIKVKPGSFNMDRDLKEAMKMLGDFSGRGPLGPLKEVSPALNGVFFSVRLNTARIMFARNLWSASPFVRRRAWKNFLAAFGTYSSFIMGGQQAGFWDVETDPRSSDFMKIVLFDRTRVDIWGGLQQFATLLGRLFSVAGTGNPVPQIKSATTGQLREEPNPLAILGRAARSKVSPAMNNVLEAWIAKDFKGEDIDRTDWLGWIKRNSPLAGQDLYEAFEAHGLLGLPAGATGFVGGGVQSYNLPRWDELDEYYGYSQNRSPELARELRAAFRRNPDNEAKLFLRGQITTLTTEAARRRVLQLMQEFNVDPDQVPGFASVFGRQPAGVR